MGDEVVVEVVVEDNLAGEEGGVKGKAAEEVEEDEDEEKDALGDEKIGEDAVGLLIAGGKGNEEEDNWRCINQA